MLIEPTLRVFRFPGNAIFISIERASSGKIPPAKLAWRKSLQLTSNMHIIGIHNLGDIMKATVVDLRYKMNEVLKALDRRENVTLLYHGKIKGTIIPVGGKKTILVKDHPFFNMAQKETKSVSQKMDELRGSRFNDI